MSYGNYDSSFASFSKYPHLRTIYCVTKVKKKNNEIDTSAILIPTKWKRKKKLKETNTHFEQLTPRVPERNMKAREEARPKKNASIC